MSSAAPSVPLVGSPRWKGGHRDRGSKILPRLPMQYNSIHLFRKLKAAEIELDGVRPDWSDIDSDSNFMLYRNHALNREKQCTIEFV